MPANPEPQPFDEAELREIMEQLQESGPFPYPQRITTLQGHRLAATLSSYSRLLAEGEEAQPLTREQVISVLGMAITGAKETAVHQQAFDLAASLRDVERLFMGQHWQEVLAAMPLDFQRGALAARSEGGKDG